MEACFGGYGSDNGDVEVGGCCNGNENWIAWGCDGGAVGLGDVGVIEGTGGTEGGGDDLAGAEGAARVVVGVWRCCKGWGWMGCALSWW